jgi:hypothetical protein
MCVRKLPSQKSSTSSPATVPEKQLMLFYGAELTGENIVDVGVLFPGSGARKTADG